MPLTVKNNSFIKTIFVLCSIFSVFFIVYWVFMTYMLDTGSGELADLFSNTYGFIALLGSIPGFLAFKKWGGWGSYLGKALFLFSLGLLFQFLGQASFVYYRVVLGIDNPYPSFGELFYFGSLPIYIFGAYYLYRAVKFRTTSKVDIYKNSLLFGLPLAMLCVAYYLFLRDYVFEDVTPLIVFLDFGYPLLQAVLFSIALSIFLLTNKVIGGLLRSPVLTLLISIFLQYTADTIYSIRIINETWYGGDVSDLLYIISYFSMSISLYMFLNSFNRLKESSLNADVK